MKKEIKVNGVKQVVEIEMTNRRGNQSLKPRNGWYDHSISLWDLIIDGKTYEIAQSFERKTQISRPTIHLWFKSISFPDNQTRLAEYILNN